MMMQMRHRNVEIKHVFFIDPQHVKYDDFVRLDRARVNRAVFRIWETRGPLE